MLALWSLCSIGEAGRGQNEQECVWGGGSVTDKSACCMAWESEFRSPAPHDNASWVCKPVNPSMDYGGVGGSGMETDRSSELTGQSVQSVGELRVQ